MRDPSQPARKKRPQGEVGNALRSAYQRMVDEDIPPEMLDLLGKLG
ncbi:MAG TPA: NepR family anti-sigma factor [Allosphingosinicella sp.]|nr:NepR family anti-sigma factor [Allosphingosinicella sp.]